MKLQITPTPAGTGYRCECLDLPGTPPVGEGATPEEAVACLFYVLLADRRTAWAWLEHIPTNLIEINGVFWRREGERGEQPNNPISESDLAAVGVIFDRWGGKSISFSHGEQLCSESLILKAGEKTAAVAAWKRLRADLAAASPPAVGVPVDREQMLKRFRREFLFLMPGIVLTDKKRGFVDRMARRAVWALEKEGILPDSGDKEMPPHIEWDVNGVPVQVVERLLKRAIEDDGGWHIHDADLTWFKEHYEAARQGKVYVDTLPSRGVPVEVCEPIAVGCKNAIENYESQFPIVEGVLIKSDNEPEHIKAQRAFVAAVQAARRGEVSGQAESHLQCDRNLATVTADAARLASELSAAQAEVERLESLVYKRMENEQLNLACRFRLGHMAGVPQGEVGGHSDMNLVEMVYQKLLAASGGNSVGE